MKLYFSSNFNSTCYNLLVVGVVLNSYPSAVGEKHPTAAHLDRLDYFYWLSKENYFQGENYWNVHQQRGKGENFFTSDLPLFQSIKHLLPQWAVVGYFSPTTEACIIIILAMVKLPKFSKIKLCNWNCIFQAISILLATIY